jgi:mono/diheme cytochrome c family protein
MRRVKAILAGGFLSMVVSSATPAADGEALFNSVCALCHQAGGTGSPGLAPALVDRALWDRLGAWAPIYIADVMLGGLSGPIEASGTTYTGLIMPPQIQLSDEELAAIGTYVLSQLNNTHQQLNASAVAEIRAAGPPSHTKLRELRRAGK